MQSYYGYRECCHTFSSLLFVASGYRYGYQQQQQRRHVINGCRRRRRRVGDRHVDDDDHYSIISVNPPSRRHAARHLLAGLSAVAEATAAASSAADCPLPIDAAGCIAFAYIALVCRGTRQLTDWRLLSYMNTVIVLNNSSFTSLITRVISLYLVHAGGVYCYSWTYKLYKHCNTAWVRANFFMERVGLITIWNSLP